MQESDILSEIKSSDDEVQSRHSLDPRDTNLPKLLVSALLNDLSIKPSTKFNTRTRSEVERRVLIEVTRSNERRRKGGINRCYSEYGQVF